MGDPLWCPSAAFTGVALLLARKQFRDGYEHRFVERFWLLEDQRLQAEHSSCEDEVGDFRSKRYLRLCEDE